MRVSSISATPTNSILRAPTKGPLLNHKTSRREIMEDASMIDRDNSPDHRVVAVVQRLVRERLIANGLAIRNHHKLIEIGLTSLDLARLVLMVEDEFDLIIPMRDLIPANFRSISTIVQLISKLAEASS
jgi:acyl carrier protein